MIIKKSFESLKKKSLLIRKLNNCIDDTFDGISKGFNKGKHIENELNELKILFEIFNE